MCAGRMRASALGPIEQELRSGRWHVRNDEGVGGGGEPAGHYVQPKAEHQPTHSPAHDGLHPRCVYHSPPMDSIKADRNNKQRCVHPLCHTYLKLNLLTLLLHVPQRNKRVSRPKLSAFTFKC